MRIAPEISLMALGVVLSMSGCESFPKKATPDNYNRSYGSYSWWNNRQNETRNGQQLKGDFGDSGTSLYDYGVAEESGFEF